MRTQEELRAQGIEVGAASIRIELTDGNLTVFHGTCGDVLLHVNNAEDGSWDKLWETLRSIQAVQTKQQ